MDPASSLSECGVGDDVYGSDDEKIGHVVAVDGRVLTIERGLIGKQRWFVPLAAVMTCDNGKVYLDATRDEAEQQGWAAPPPVATDADGRTIQGIAPAIDPTGAAHGREPDRG